MCSLLFAWWTLLYLNQGYGTPVLGEANSVLLAYFMVFGWPFILNLSRLRKTGNYRAFEVVTWLSLVFWLSGYISLFLGKTQLLEILQREKENVTLVNQELSVVWDFPLDGFSLNWGTFYLFNIFPAIFEERGLAKTAFLIADALLSAKIPFKISNMPMMLSPGIFPLILYAF